MNEMIKAEHLQENEVVYINNMKIEMKRAEPVSNETPFLYKHI